jgi:hypothetical protein
MMVSYRIADNPCKDIGKLVKEEWGFGKWVLTLVKPVSNAVKLAVPVIEGIHGSILAFSIRVSRVADDGYVTDDEGSTHYGHEQPGKELRFGIRVEMLDELPDIVVQCGWLLGVEFPRKGPIEGVTVLWTMEEGDLRRHGELNCGSPCTTKTAADGIASLVFRPKNEDSPFGQGLKKAEVGVLSGVALYQSRHKNYLGSFNQIITPKWDFLAWLVEFHEGARVWHGEVTITSTQSDHYSFTNDGSNGYICSACSSETTTRDSDYRYVATMILEPDGNDQSYFVQEDGSEFTVFKRIPATITVNEHFNEVFHQVYFTDCESGTRTRTFEVIAQETVELEGSLSIDLSTDVGHYVFSLNRPPEITHRRTESTSYRAVGADCVARDPSTTTGEYMTSLRGGFAEGLRLEGEIDPDNPDQITINVTEPQFQGSYTVNVQLRWR